MSDDVADTSSEPRQTCSPAVPRSQTNASKERAGFVLEWERRWKAQEGVVNVSERCREFGITRECGHKTIRRHRDGGFDLAGIEERSRRPHHSPTATSPATEDLIVSARKAKPKWGPVKLRSWLLEQNPSADLPSASTIAVILKRRGLVTPPSGAAAWGPSKVCPHPLQRAPCVHFKGWFETQDRLRCYPLTLTDAFGRFVPRCEAMREGDGKGVFSVFDSAFRELAVSVKIVGATK